MKLSQKKWYISCFTLVILAIALYLLFILFPSAKSTRGLRIHQDINNSFRDICDVRTPLNVNDILSDDGNPLLSWRVGHFLKCAEQYPHFYEKRASFNINESWTSPINMEAGKNKPFFCFYPYYLEPNLSGRNMKTCLVLVKEIAELKKNDPNNEIIKDKALVVLVDPQFAVIWTEPTDISWHDLASGKIKLFSQGTTIPYIRAGNLEPMTKDRCPETVDEWKEFCGVD